MRILLGFLIFIMSTGMSFAENDLGFPDTLKQGGFYVGKITPGDKITFHGERVKISEDGYFVIGLGWKYKSQANIRVDHKVGGHTMYQLPVKVHEYDVEHIEGLPPKYVTPPENLLKRIRKDAADVRKVRRVDSDLQNFREEMIWPVEGRISGRFGSHRVYNGKPGSMHTGLDIAPGQGALIVAPLGGKVTLISDQYLTGITLMIDHGHGLNSVYAHMEKAIAEDGQMIKKGEPIGTVGMTGRATGPHLHWGMNWYGERLNPAVALGIE